MIILYVPFTLDESIIDMADRAKRWVSFYQNNCTTEIEQQIPVIVYYKMETTSDEQKENIEQAIQNGNTKIYILAHGLDRKEFCVANVRKISDPEFDKVIEIGEVAKRFNEDFIQDHEFNQSNIIKLYFCDPYVMDSKAKRMAQMFYQSLSANSIHQSHIQYYSGANISGPIEQSIEFTQALYARKENTGKKEKTGNKVAAKNITLNCCNDLITISIGIIGSPSLFRHTLDSTPSNDNVYVDLSNINPLYQPIMQAIILEIEGLWEFNPQLAKRKNIILSEIIDGLCELFDNLLLQVVSSAVEKTKSDEVSKKDSKYFNTVADTDKEFNTLSLELKGGRGLPVKIETTKANIMVLLASYQSLLKNKADK